MKIRDLIQLWESNASAPLTDREYQVRLPLYDAAKLAALAEMYPGRSEESLITELLAAALDELGGSFAYIEGSKIVAHDDMGDPIFEDEGLTPRFHKLSKAHAKRMLADQTRGNQA